MLEIDLFCSSLSRIDNPSSLSIEEYVCDVKNIAFSASVASRSKPLKAPFLASLHVPSGVVDHHLRTLVKSEVFRGSCEEHVPK